MTPVLAGRVKMPQCQYMAALTEMTGEPMELRSEKLEKERKYRAELKADIDLIRKRKDAERLQREEEKQRELEELLKAEGRWRGPENHRSPLPPVPSPDAAEENLRRICQRRQTTQFQESPNNPLNGHHPEHGGSWSGSKEHRRASPRPDDSWHGGYSGDRDGGGENGGRYSGGGGGGGGRNEDNFGKQQVAEMALAYVWNGSAVGEELYGAWEFEEHFAPHVDRYVDMCCEFIAEIGPRLEVDPPA